MSIYITLKNVERRQKFPYQVHSLGYIENAPAVKFVRSTFPDYIEFNIRLSGHGFADVRLNDADYLCTYPHVLIKRPQTPYEYANLSKRNCFYICYSSETAGLFADLNYFEDELLWEFDMSSEIEFLLKKIMRLMNYSRKAGIADRIDLDCFTLLNELIWQRSNKNKEQENSQQKMIMRADSYLHFHLCENIDFEELAKEFGMSRSTFFRRWKEYFNDTPSNYFMNLKLEESARLLQQKRFKIYEIAKMLNFNTSTYFCALFRKKFGMTPQEYEKSFSVIEK